MGEVMSEFKSLEELYSRIKPALYSKREEFKRSNISYIKEEDIWNYLSSTVWKKKSDLTLSEMVSDIMCLKLEDIKSYIFDILRKRDIEISKEDGSLL